MKDMKQNHRIQNASLSHQDREVFQKHNACGSSETSWSTYARN